MNINRSAGERPPSGRAPAHAFAWRYRAGTALRRCRRFGSIAIGAATCAVTMVTATAADPDVIYVRGTVRDFMKSHPDFNVPTTGHVANNVAMTTETNRPIFTGNVGTAGFEVAAQWRDKHNRNIAPHLFQNGGTMLLGGPPDIGGPSWNQPVLDSWNSDEGTYDPNNAGDPPDMYWPAPMPEINAPEGLPPHPNNNIDEPLNLGAGGTHTFDQSFQCGNLSMGQDTTIHIAPDTDVVIYTTGSFSLGQNSKIIIPEGSSLHIYHEGDLDIARNGKINMTSPLQPDRCWIYNLGTGTMRFNQDGKICAHLVAPQGSINLKQNDAFYGTILADSLQMDQGSSLHWDMNLQGLCEGLQDQLGNIGLTSAGAISSNGEYFHEWFTDVLGTNMSFVHTIKLVRNAEGIYEYLDDAFFPIDGHLFGNEGDDHNYNFTFTFSAQFVYDQCQGGFFEFQGADDAWVYIDGKLAMDLGGVLPMTKQIVDVDRLNLEDGETYTLHFYYAQRNSMMSVFQMRTNLPLESDPPPAVSAMFD